MAGFSQQKPSADTLYDIQENVLIPTRSGVDLSAIIVRKKENLTSLPVILFYTTYYQGEGDAFFGKKSADREYVGVVVYARGIKTDLNN